MRGYKEIRPLSFGNCMKPTIGNFRFISIVLFSLLGFMQIKAADFEVDGVFYNILSEGDANVSGKVEVTFPTDYSTYTNDIVIPDYVTFEGISYAVVAIGKDAFSGSDQMKKCIIGSNVTQIKRGAFANTGLNSLNITSNVEIIEEEAIVQNINLTEVYIDSKYVGMRGFAYNFNLAKLTFGSNVMTICENAFAGDNRITQLHIPSFEKWNSIDIGSTEYGIFGYEIYSDNHYDLMDLYIDGKKTTDVVIPDDVMSVSSFVFEGCNIRSVELPNSVESIGTRVFSKCGNLVSVKFSDRLRTIGNFAFLDNKSLEKIVLPSSLEYVGESAFASCVSLDSVEIPDGVTSMGEGVFSNCKSLKDVKIGSGLTSIPVSGFSGCDHLGEITIPENIKVICKSAFSDCDRLGKVMLGKNVNNLESGAFSNCTSLQQIISYNPEPPKVHIQQHSWGTDISTFSGVEKKFCRVFVPAEVVDDYRLSNGWDDFSCISSIEEGSDSFKVGNLYYRLLEGGGCEVTSGFPAPVGEVVIPGEIEYEGKNYNVIGIGDYAFYNNKDITRIEINEGVRYVGDYSLAFETALEFVSFPASMERIGDFALVGCAKLAIIESHSVNPPSLEGNYVTFDYETLQDAVLYIPLTEAYAGSDGEWNRFRRVEYTDFKGGVYFVHIGTLQKAFYKITGDGTCELAKALYCDGYFYAGAETVYYKENDYSVTSVAEKAFCGMPYLSFVYFYPSVVSVSANAFGDDCDNMLLVGCDAAAPPVLDGELFENPEMSSKIYLLVPEESEELYRNDKNWSSAGVVITTIPSETKDMFVFSAYPGNRAIVSGNNNFRNDNAKINEYAIPDKIEIGGVMCDVTQILGDALSKCSQVNSLSLPGSLKILSKNAFRGCGDIPELRVCAVEPPVFIGDPWISSGMYKNTQLHVPAESADLYRQSEYWKDFVNIIPTEGLSGIDEVLSESHVFSILNGCLSTGGMSVSVYDISGSLIIKGSGLLQLPDSGIFIIVPESGKSVKVVIP